MRLTFDCESVEVQRKVELKFIQYLVGPYQEAFESTANVPQVGLGEFHEKTMGHPKKTVTVSEGGGRGDHDGLPASKLAGH